MQRIYLLETINLQLSAIQKHSHTSHSTSHIVDPLGKKREGIIVNFGHSESSKVWFISDFGVFFAFRIGGNLLTSMISQRDKPRVRTIKDR